MVEVLCVGCMCKVLSRTSRGTLQCTTLEHHARCLASHPAPQNHMQGGVLYHISHRERLCLLAVHVACLFPSDHLQRVSSANLALHKPQITAS